MQHPGKRDPDAHERHAEAQDLHPTDRIGTHGGARFDAKDAGQHRTQQDNGQPQTRHDPTTELQRQEHQGSRLLDIVRPERVSDHRASRARDSEPGHKREALHPQANSVGGDRLRQRGQMLGVLVVERDVQPRRVVRARLLDRRAHVQRRARLAVLERVRARLLELQLKHGVIKVEHGRAWRHEREHAVGADDAVEDAREVHRRHRRLRHQHPVVVLSRGAGSENVVEL